MRHEISDILRTAADGPPLRHTADDALAAGKKRQRRRRATWAAATVLAVAAVVAVPQVLRTEHVAVPPPAAPADFPYPAEDLTGTIAGFQVGSLTITDTAWVSEESMGAVISGPGLLGGVTFYSPGAPKLPVTGSPVPIGRVTGYYQSRVLPLGQGATENFFQLAWHYAPNTVATIVIRGTGTVSQEDLRAVAVGLRPAPPRRMRVGFKLGYVPRGYTVVSVMHASPRWAPQPGQSSVKLVNGENSFSVYVQPASEVRQKAPAGGWPSGSPYCIDRHCYRATEDGKYVADAAGSLTRAESERILERLTFADLTDPGTWPDAAEAVR